MLGAEFVPVRNDVTLEIPALLEITVGTDLLDTFGRVDKVHLFTGAMHQAQTYLADVVIASPLPTPHGLLLGLRLESWFGLRTEKLDCLIVDTGHVDTQELQLEQNA